jgi:hypothetical protein
MQNPDSLSSSLTGIRCMKPFALLYAMLLFAAPAHALYDPPPEPAIAAVEGAWSGTLRYRDYQNPDRFETLPTRTTVVLSAPDTLTLHAIYDDGPNKTVHSYEQMAFDIKAHRLQWRYGLKADDIGSYDIVASTREGDCHRFTAERKENDSKGLNRYTIALCATQIEFVKLEIDAQGVSLERSRTTLSRASKTP